jgi:hypothetical protein
MTLHVRKELKEFSEVRNAAIKIINSMARVKGRVDSIECRISKLEDKSEEITQYSEQKKSLKT